MRFFVRRFDWPTISSSAFVRFWNKVAEPDDDWERNCVIKKKKTAESRCRHLLNEKQMPYDGGGAR